MNYFGLIFSFMIPGIIIGLLGGSIVSDIAHRRRRKRRMGRQK